MPEENVHVQTSEEITFLPGEVARLYLYTDPERPDYYQPAFIFRESLTLPQRLQILKGWMQVIAQEQLTTELIVNRRPE